jgi:two-component system response regulator CpxR
MTQILLIDDDTELCSLLTEYLKTEGFDVTCCFDGKNGAKEAITNRFEAIILDVMLPKMNGFEVLKAIRQHSNTPVLMLTARGDDVDRIVGLEIGADDYLSKPCNPRELIARIKAILRRSEVKPVHKSTLVLHNITLDSTKRTVTLDDSLLELTNAEFNILEMLMKSPGQAFSKEELTKYGLGRKYTAFDRSIDVHISNLRNKLGDNPKGNAYIKTVRGFGYLFDA